MSQDTIPSDLSKRVGDRVRIDRTIPLWGIVTLCLAMCGQAILLWQGQRESVIEQRNTSKKVDSLAAAIGSMDNQARQRDTKDAGRDSLIAEHERRITRIETKLESAR